MGVPTIGSSLRDVGIPFRDGHYWFVDQTTGNDGNDGQGIDTPFATIQEAIDTSQSGDTIVIAPGSYDENLSVLSSRGKDYLTLIGWSPSGYARPDVVPTAGMALIVQAQGFVCKHIRFAGAGVGGIGVQQMGNGFLYDDCVFESSSNIGFRLFPDANDSSFTASEGMVLNSLIRDCAGGGISFENPGAPAGVGATDVIIQGCRFYGNTGNDIFDVQAGALYTVQRVLITGNQFLTKDPTSYIDLSAGAATNSGLISNNYFAFSTAGGLTNGEIILGNDIVFSGNCDGVGVVDGHTF